MESSISGMINKLFMNLQNVNKNQGGLFSLTPSQLRIMMFIGQRINEGKKTFQKDIEREFNLKGSSVTSI
ncbi:MAG: helix-turn-helix domain-containing protein, partial [bacterium]|nr:helix-turn-helix domain-containing protein [bacterium]